jgi:death-on-curing protein
MDFLGIEDILALHADQVDLYGGEHGARDMGLLESAAAQPRWATASSTPPQPANPL